MSGNIPTLVRWLVHARILPKAAVMQLDPNQVPIAQSVLDAGRLTEHIFRVLDEIDHDLVLIARMGQNLSGYGLTYSHLGFAIRNEKASGWSIVHLLTADHLSDSRIFVEGLTNFMADNPYRFEAGIITLPAAVRAAALRSLRSHGQSLHCAAYSLTSYPWSLTAQNSNQWVLEVLARAMAEVAGQPVQNRAEAQAWLRQAGYTPTVLHIGLPTQWAGPLLRETISFEDQPEHERRQGRVSTVTVDSVLQFLTGLHRPLGEGTKDCRLVKLSLNLTTR